MCRHEDHPFKIVANRISGKKYNCASGKEVLVLRIDDLDSLEQWTVTVNSQAWHADPRLLLAAYGTLISDRATHEHLLSTCRSSWAIITYRLFVFLSKGNRCGMNTIVPRRPLTNFPFLLPSAFAPLSQAPRRHESSSRRTTKKLRVKPDPSFTASISPSQIHDHIVFNPPSSAPSPYQTPAAFLPRSDPRRELLFESHQHANPYSDPSRKLPPAVMQRPEKKYHLREKEIEEIRRLRTEDPNKWTMNKLADRFQCSQFFIGMVAKAPKGRIELAKKDLEAVKQKWGQRRTRAREDRQKRRELWGRDE